MTVSLWWSLMMNLEKNSLMGTSISKHGNLWRSIQTQALQVLLSSLSPWGGEGVNLLFLSLSHLERTNCKRCRKEQGLYRVQPAWYRQQWPARGCTHRLQKQQKGLEVGVDVYSSLVSKVILLSPYLKEKQHISHGRGYKKRTESHRKSGRHGHQD